MDGLEGTAEREERALHLNVNGLRHACGNGAGYIQSAYKATQRHVEVKWTAGSVLGTMLWSYTANFISADPSMHDGALAARNQLVPQVFNSLLSFKICELLATRIKHKGRAYAAAIIIPTALSFGLAFGFHSQGHTKRLYATTIPPLIINLGSSAAYARSKRQQYEQAAAHAKAYATAAPSNI